MLAELLKAAISLLFKISMIMWNYTLLSDIRLERAQRNWLDKYNIQNVFTNYHEMFAEGGCRTICHTKQVPCRNFDCCLCKREYMYYVKSRWRLRAEECEAMIEASKNADKVLTIAYHYRFMKEARQQRK